MINLALKLYDLNKRRSISVNHSVMEILVAAHLLEEGYEDVDVESPLGGLVADVVATKNGSKTIVEIETGFTPAEHSVDPVEYLRARIIGKAARYSAHSDKFVLAFPIYYLPPIPPALLKNPSERSVEEVKQLSDIINAYYKNPPLSIEDIMKARLDHIYILHVDRGKVFEIDPKGFLELYTSGKNWFDTYGYIVTRL
ncbi:conserved protein of unknown function [Desulfurococcaceae archaeon AG1]|nr:MAG: hypothetical protein DJ555_00365 [Desulfurococcaceae archaeon]GAY26424.1 conserved protein of unknown function [Desulfurococcaceae archaeon AG1]